MPVYIYSCDTVQVAMCVYICHPTRAQQQLEQLLIGIPAPAPAHAPPDRVSMESVYMDVCLR